jgi:hypothetical protein
MKQDHQFEQSFSELAYSALQNSFPDLLQKSVGFQLVDSNDENTKALGIFAIQMAGSHLYIPVFFVGGRLKPLELIYDKKGDKFFPLTRDWIELLAKGPELDIGSSAAKPGIGISNPNLEVYANPPRTGRMVTSSAKLSSSEIDRMLTKAASSSSLPLDLFLASAPKLVKKSFLHLMQDNPSYLDNVLTHYSWDMLKTACLVQPDRYAPKDPVGEFEVITDMLHKKASPQISKEVLQKGFYVLDKRAGMAADAYFTKSIMKFESALDTGLYEIMDSSGEVKNYLVIQGECDDDRNKYEACRDGDDLGKKGIGLKRDITIVDIKDGSWYKSSDLNQVMGKKNHEGKFVVDTILKSLPSVKDMSPNKKYMLLLKKGDSFVARGPFEVTSSFEDKGLTQFQVRSCSDYKPCKILVREGSQSLGRPREGTITATPDVRALPLKGQGSCDKFTCQSVKMLEAKAFDRGISRVEVSTDGVEYQVNSLFGNKSGLDKKAAITHLCLDYNLKSEDTLKLLKIAEEDKRSGCFIKQAVGPYGDPMPPAGPQYAPMPMAAMTDPSYQNQQYWPEQYAHQEWNPAPPTGPRQGFSPEIGPANMAEQPQHASPTAAIQGAQTGDKDLLDAGTISSMANFSDVDDLVNDYLPDLEKAMDKVGRMVFLYWYKTENFAEKFSSTEIKETEDLLRNLFKELGKTIHKFKSSKSESANMIKRD